MPSVLDVAQELLEGSSAVRHVPLPEHLHASRYDAVFDYFLATNGQLVVGLFQSKNSEAAKAVSSATNKKLQDVRSKAEGDDGEHYALDDVS